MSYLKDREDAWIKEQMQLDRNREQEIIKRMRQAIDAIQIEIDANWQNFSDGQRVTIEEARKRANELDVKRFARKAKEYVKTKDFSPQANRELKLYNLVMRVSRLELLKAEIGLELITCFDDLEKWGYGEITKAAKNEFERQAGILGEQVSTNYNRKVKRIIEASFKSSEFASFSDNIWQNFTEMKLDLEKLITRSITQGKNPRAIAKEMEQFLKPNQENTKFKLNRLMITEITAVQTDVQNQSYLDNGITEYDFITEPSACQICLDVAKGNPYKVAKFEKGVNAPYMHPHCKCSTAGHIDRKKWDAELKARGL